MGASITLGKMRTLFMLAFLTDIEAFHRTMVSHHPSVNQAFTTLPLMLLQNQVILESCVHKLFAFGELLKSIHHILGNIHVRH